MNRVITRAVYSDPWINQFGLALISTGSAVFFALPLGTFATYPSSYALMNQFGPEWHWALLFAALALLTWWKLWLEATADTPIELQFTGRLASATFGLFHGPVWLFVGWSVIHATPAAFFPWWTITAFLLSEWLALQPTVQRLWEGWRGSGE